MRSRKRRKRARSYRRSVCAVLGKPMDADAPQGAPNRTLFLVIEHEMRHFGRVAALLFGAIFGEPGGAAPKAPDPLLKASEVVQSADATIIVSRLDARTVKRMSVKTATIILRR